MQPNWQRSTHWAATRKAQPPATVFATFSLRCNHSAVAAPTSDLQAPARHHAGPGCLGAMIPALAGVAQGGALRQSGCRRDFSDRPSVPCCQRCLQMIPLRTLNIPAALKRLAALEAVLRVLLCVAVHARLCFFHHALHIAAREPFCRQL